MAGRISRPLARAAHVSVGVRSIFRNSHGCLETPRLIAFKLDECVSLSFNVNIGSSVYKGKLDSNGFISYDKSILSQLFFKIIDSFKVSDRFTSMKKLKGPILNQIPKLDTAFSMIKEFNKLQDIVLSSEKIEIKLNKDGWKGL